MIHPETKLLTPGGFKYVADCYDCPFLSVDPITRMQYWDAKSEIEEHEYAGSMYRLQARNTDIRVTPEHPIAHISRNKVVIDTASDLFFTNGKLPQFSRAQLLERLPNEDVLWSARIVALAAVQNTDLDEDEFTEAFSIAERIGYADARDWVNEFVHWNVKRPLRSTGFVALFGTINERARDTFRRVAIKAGYHCVERYRKGRTLGWKHFSPGDFVYLIIYVARDLDTSYQPEQWSIERHEGLCYTVKNGSGLLIAKHWGRTFLMSVEQGR